MRRVTRELIELVQTELASRADPAKAGPMQKYMRTEDPFYGVQKPDRVPIVRAIRKRFPIEEEQVWEEGVLALWDLPHREEKYIALEYAALGKQFHTPKALALYARLIRSGAWWDLVDFVAVGLVSPTLLYHREAVAPAIERWIDDDDLWIRRAALLSQIRHKEQTDEEQLYRHCLERAAEREFFIRKAIGWALRDYSWFRPESVKQFLAAHAGELSSLSRREAAKRLVKLGLLG